MYRKLRSMFVLSAIIAVAVGTAMATSDNLSVVASFNPSLGQLPESVTADAEGNFYLSMANTVHKLTPDGALTLFAQLGNRGAGGVADLDAALTRFARRAKRPGLALVVSDLLTPDETAYLRGLFDKLTFVDGRATNQHSKVKNNLQLDYADPGGRQITLALIRPGRIADDAKPGLPSVKPARRRA